MLKVGKLDDKTIRLAVGSIERYRTRNTFKIISEMHRFPVDRISFEAGFHLPTILTTP